MTLITESPDVAAALETEKKKNADLLAQLDNEKKLRESADIDKKKVLANAQVDGWERDGRLSGNSVASFRALHVAAATGEPVTAEMIAAAVATLPKIDTTRLAQHADPTPAASAVTLEEFKKAGTDVEIGKRVMAVVDERRKTNPKFSVRDLERELLGKK